MDLFFHFAIIKKNYVFYDLNGEPDQFFTKSQLVELDKQDSVLALSMIGVINQQSDEINFYIFSIKDFNIFTIKDFTIVCDGKETKIKRNIAYNANTKNPNFDKTVSYEFENKKIQGFEKKFYGGFENFKRCKVNFYKIFKSKNVDFGEKFNVKILVHYFLDEREYSQELYYTVECREAPQYPPNWFMALFPYAY